MTANGDRYMIGSRNADVSLTNGQRLTSPNKLFFAVMQGDDNFLVYSYDLNFFPYQGILYNAGTQNNGGIARATMQPDGNFVIYANQKVLFASHTHWSYNSMTQEQAKGSYLVMQDDGNLVLYTEDNQPLWATGMSPACNSGMSAMVPPVG